MTGGAKGIGAAITTTYAQEGAIAVAGDRDAPACQALHDEVRAQGFQASFIAMDVAASENCKAIVQPAIATFDHVDARVNNAGINDREGLEHGSAQEFICSLERNLLHYYNMAYYSVPHLKRARGSICQCRFKNGAHQSGRTSGYVASKPAILGMTHEWATALLPYGIRVNAVVPAEVMTPHYQERLPSFASPEEKLKSVVAKIPSTGE